LCGIAVFVLHGLQLLEISLFDVLPTLVEGSSASVAHALEPDPGHRLFECVAFSFNLGLAASGAGREKNTIFAKLLGRGALVFLSNK